MSNLKKYKGHCVGGKNPAIHDIIIEAINPPQARQFLEARFPGFRTYYTSAQVSDWLRIVILLFISTWAIIILLVEKALKLI